MFETSLNIKFQKLSICEPFEKKSFSFSRISFELQNIFSIGLRQKMRIGKPNRLVYSWIGFEKFLVPKIQKMLFFSTFQFTKIRLKKTAPNNFFIFTYVNPWSLLKLLNPILKNPTCLNGVNLPSKLKIWKKCHPAKF